MKSSSNDMTASQQLEAMQRQLLQAYVERDNLSERLASINVAIKTIRDALSGVPIGERKEREAQPIAVPTEADEE